MTGVPWVEFRESAGWDSLEHFLGENSQQLPANVQWFKHRAVLVAALRDEVLLEFRQELQIEQIVWRQRFLSYDGFHCLHVFSDGVTSVLENTHKLVTLNTIKQ